MKMEHFLYVEKSITLHSIKANVSTNTGSSSVTSKNFGTLYLITPVTVSSLYLNFQKGLHISQLSKS